jgi:iodotyrosine deiodinase
MVSSIPAARRGELWHDYVCFDPETQVRNSREFAQRMAARRSIRRFAHEPVPLEVIENAIRAAGTAPSGANKQPWFFAVVADPGLRAKIRIAAEQQEHEFYEHRASDEWLNDLKPMGTNASKPHLEDASYLIVVFAEQYGIDPETGEKRTNYYVHESVGIAVGMLVTSLHLSGLGTLTHTPCPMRFLNTLLHVPRRFRPFVLIATGIPERPVMLPNLTKKSLAEISKIY